MALLALPITDFDIGQRKVVAVEQLGHFGGRQQGFSLGAAVVRGFGAQTLDSGLEPVKGSEVRVYGHGHHANCSAPISPRWTVMGTPAQSVTVNDSVGIFIGYLPAFRRRSSSGISAIGGPTQPTAKRIPQFGARPQSNPVTACGT